MSCKDYQYYSMMYYCINKFSNTKTIAITEIKTIEAWQALKVSTGLSSARLLKVLIDNAYEVPLLK